MTAGVWTVVGSRRGYGVVMWLRCGYGAVTTYTKIYNVRYSYNSPSLYHSFLRSPFHSTD